MKTLLITLLLTTTVAVAEVPSLINYQGRLTGPGGAPASGTKNFALKIYDAATDGTLLYSEDVGAITLGEGGVYSFRFGATGTSNTLVTETVGTGTEENLYQKVLSNTPVVAGSVSVTDGTYTWSQSAGSSNEDDFNASFSTNLNRITVNYFAGAPNDGREIQVTYRYGAAGIVGALSSGSGHWLELSIDGQVQATRERVLAVPFALRAGTVDEVPRRRATKHIMHVYNNTNFAQLLKIDSQSAPDAWIPIPEGAKKLICIKGTYPGDPGVGPWVVRLVGINQGGNFVTIKSKSIDIPEDNRDHLLLMSLNWELDPNAYSHLTWSNSRARSAVILEYEY